VTERLVSRNKGLFGSVCRGGVLVDIIAGLEAFLRVAKPRLMGVTQPAIPQQVSGLEQRWSHCARVVGWNFIYPDLCVPKTSCG
jgi:hypothetical protein